MIHLQKTTIDTKAASRAETRKRKKAIEQAWACRSFHDKVEGNPPSDAEIARCLAEVGLDAGKQVA